MSTQIPSSKIQIPNNNEIINVQNSKPYNLDERTFRFAERCRDFVQRLPRTPANIEYCVQLIRSSGSQAANYIEANESLSKKDFAYRIRICRKEVKESCLWVKLCLTSENRALQEEQTALIQESIELKKIFHCIVEKSK